ncbi:hypothetical protein B0H11DRAFT_3149 [Mycena galericulata]|nr:hypothetical protein B0H11DRAFT_3149 [Mycena galericulata]
MSAILWLLAVLRKLGASLTRLLIKALVPLLSVASRAIKGFPSDTTANGSRRIHQTSDTSDGFFGTNLLPRGSSTTDGAPIPSSQISPSLAPPFLHPYRLSGASASRSSQDIGTLPIQLRTLSPLDSRLRSRSPSPIGSPRASVADISFSSAGSTHSSEGLQAAIFPQSLGQVDPRLKIGTPEAVMYGRYSKGVFIPKEPTQYTIAALTFSPLPCAPFTYLVYHIYFL